MIERSENIWIFNRNRFRLKHTTADRPNTDAPYSDNCSYIKDLNGKLSDIVAM